jgi:exonuclease V gamma subunit
MLTVYDSNRLEVLGDPFTQLVRQPTNSPFVLESVIGQRFGVAPWRSFCLTGCPGVCAHVHFSFPATFIRDLFQRMLTNVPETSPCRVGMNDGTFLHARHSLNFARIAQDVRRGDGSRRDEDCYLIREALLSARRYRCIRHAGRHIRNNSVIPPSVIVSARLDTITRGFYPAINRREMPGCVWS